MARPRPWKSLPLEHVQRFGRGPCALTVALVLGAASVFWCCSSTAGSGDEKAMGKIIDASDATQVIEARNLLLDDASEDQLRTFRANAHEGVALYAAWEEATRAAKASGKLGPVQRDSVERFLGFAEGRLGISLPKWWETAMRSALTTDGKGGLIRYAAGNSLHFYRGTGIVLQGQGPELRVHSGAKLRVKDGKLLVCVEGHSLVIPTSVLAEPAAGEELDFLVDSDRCYVAAHIDGGFEFPLICLTRTGRVLWTAKVWSAHCQSAFGQCYQRVTLVSGKDRVLVFGAEPYAMFIEAFDKKSGKNHFRFSTWYYPDRR